MWPRLLFVAALPTSAWAWWQFAWPIATGGATALFIGWTRRSFRYHKLAGYTYLIGGSLGAVMGLVLSLKNAHGISGITVATGTLAVVWLATAAMAFRSARNRRFDAHWQWMIRSYVLTWTFAGCRAAGRVPMLESLGDSGGAAIIWLSWIVPVLVCEIALQWRATSAADRARHVPG